MSMLNGSDEVRVPDLAFLPFFYPCWVLVIRDLGLSGALSRFDVNLHSSDKIGGLSEASGKEVSSSC